MVQFYYGATWNLSRKGPFNWRDEQAGDPSSGSGQDFETLVKTFVAPRRVLRVLADCILFTRKDEELSKVEELLHLKVPNHGKLFKSLLRAYLGGDGMAGVHGRASL